MCGAHTAIERTLTENCRYVELLTGKCSSNSIDRPKLGGRLLDIPYEDVNYQRHYSDLATATHISCKIQQCRASIYRASIYLGRWICLWGDSNIPLTSINLSFGKWFESWKVPLDLDNIRPMVDWWIESGSWFLPMQMSGLYLEFSQNTTGRPELI